MNQTQLVEEFNTTGRERDVSPLRWVAWGFAGQSLCRASNMLAITGTKKQRAIEEAMEAA